MSEATATLGRLRINKTDDDSYDIHDTMGYYVIPNVTYSELEGIYYQLKAMVEARERLQPTSRYVEGGQQ